MVPNFNPLLAPPSDTHPEYGKDCSDKAPFLGQRHALHLWRRLHCLSAVMAKVKTGLAQNKPMEIFKHVSFLDSINIDQFDGFAAFG